MNFSAWSVSYWDEAERVKERLELARRGAAPEKLSEEALQKAAPGHSLRHVSGLRPHRPGAGQRAKQRGER